MFPITDKGKGNTCIRDRIGNNCNIQNHLDRNVAHNAYYKHSSKRSGALLAIIINQKDHKQKDQDNGYCPEKT